MTPFETLIAMGSDHRSFFWDPRTCLRKMTRGFQIWSQNSNRITINPPFRQKAVKFSRILERLGNSLDFDLFWRKRGLHVIRFEFCADYNCLVRPFDLTTTVMVCGVLDSLVVVFEEDLGAGVLEDLGMSCCVASGRATPSALHRRKAVQVANRTVLAQFVLVKGA